MEKLITVAQVIVPIFVTVLLGVLARRKGTFSQEQVDGLNRFVVKYGMPCIVFRSCLTADMGAESLSSMAMVLVAGLISTAAAMTVLKKRYPYHNLPMLFVAKESGMLGIPLYMILFGADQAFRMGVLDLAQAPTAYAVIALLTADTGENPTPGRILKSIFASPMVKMSLLGLFMNLSGAGRWLDSLGVLGILTETTGFLIQPVSALIIFYVGYNFSLDSQNYKGVLEVTGILLGLYVLFGIVMQGMLTLVPNVDAATRWAAVLYCVLPASYLAPGMGRNPRDYTLASGVCSVMTVVCLVAFCVMAAIVA